MTSKFEIKKNSTVGYQVILNEKDISNLVSALEFSIESGASLPILTLKIPCHDVAADLPCEVKVDA